jgi:glycosyltransferase involved in cell wall biosynthesis
VATKLCIVTDAWWPQINGVVTTLTNLVREAEADGWEVVVIHPALFPNRPAPGYPEVQLCWPWGVRGMVRKFAPDHLHIATEGPLGLMARISFRRWALTTAYHTQWAHYFKRLFHIPESLTWRFVRWFHQHGKVMVPTPSIRTELIAQGIKSEVVLFGRGVDLENLNPYIAHTANPRPRLLSVGRVSKEKNLDAFCELNHHKYELIMVGDGPYLPELRRRYPQVTFLGMLQGADLANEYIKADCMVFASHTDTFGLVMIEAQCLGTPVAAYPVKGPVDVILPETGAMDPDINRAISAALLLNRGICAKIAQARYNWPAAWRQFRANLVDHEDQENLLDAIL